MKVFVSYSFIDSELHLLTLLLEKIRGQGHVVETTASLEDNSSSWTINDINNYKILKSDYFIGIVTNNSNSIDTVIKEWNVAKKDNIENILLVEKGVKIFDSTFPYYEFDRFNPQVTIDKLFKEQEKKKTSQDGSAILVVAGIVLGIAALISLLGKKEN